MKLHYTEILLFFLPFNILAHNKNKPYITPHTLTNTSRLLSEYDPYMPKYDNDSDIKSVKENFDRQTSRRFEEYEERIKEKRRKCKEQCDKDIQKIILKDKVEKSLSEKVENGCLRCGCGLGGVAAGVGIIGPIVINELKKAALLAATQAAIADAIAEGASQGAAMGASKFIQGVSSKFGVSTLGNQPLGSIFTATNYTDVPTISQFIYSQYSMACISPANEISNPMCNIVPTLDLIPGNVQTQVSTRATIESTLKKILAEATTAAETAKTQVTSATTAKLTTEKTGVVQATYMGYHTAIIASVGAILIIVLVMVIIYLILRYRRKNKINKKLQYTKLLNQ